MTFILLLLFFSGYVTDSSSDEQDKSVQVADFLAASDPKKIHALMGQMEVEWRHDGGGNALIAKQKKQEVESKLQSLKGKKVSWNLQVVSVTEAAVRVRAVPRWSLMGQTATGTVWSFQLENWSKTLKRDDMVTFKASILQIEVNTKDQRVSGKTISRGANYGKITGVLKDAKIEPLQLPKESADNNADKGSDAEDRACRFIEKLGGRYMYDKRLPKMPVTEIHLSDTELKDNDLKELAVFKNLAVLHIDGTEVTDAGIKEIVKHKNLVVLGLSETKVTDASLKELTSLSKLQKLHLSDTQLTDAGMREIAKFKYLTNLYCLHTKITSAGIRRLQIALPKCAIEHIPNSYNQRNKP